MKYSKIIFILTSILIFTSCANIRNLIQRKNKEEPKESKPALISNEVVVSSGKDEASERDKKKEKPKEGDRYEDELDPYRVLRD
jgi:hypothetical protein